MAVNGFKPCVGFTVSARRKSFGGAAVGQGTLGFFKKPLISYAKFVDVNVSITIEGSAIRFAFMRGSKIAHGPPILWV